MDKGIPAGIPMGMDVWIPWDYHNFFRGYGNGTGIEMQFAWQPRSSSAVTMLFRLHFNHTRCNKRLQGLQKLYKRVC